MTPLVIFIAALIITRLIFILTPKAVVKRAPSLPGHGWKIVYTDNAAAKQKREPGVVYGKVLKDPEHLLQGKPDFIYASGAEYMPVELKSGRVGESPSPREGDLMQLAVYFFLIEAEYGARPREGRLIYSDAMFTVKNTRPLRAEVLSKVAEMENMLDNPPDAEEVLSGDIQPEFNKCRRCPCRGTVCETEIN